MGVRPGTIVPQGLSKNVNVFSVYYFLPPNQERKSSLNIKVLDGIFLGHQGPRRRDILDKSFMQVGFFCCFRQGVARMSRDYLVGTRDVPDLAKFHARNFGLIFRLLPRNP